jgi:hypothetical protein
MLKFLRADRCTRPKTLLSGTELTHGNYPVSLGSRQLENSFRQSENKRIPLMSVSSFMIVHQNYTAALAPNPVNNTIY